MTPAEFKTIRQTIGISAQNFAELLNVEPRTIQRMENGLADPKGFAVDLLQSLYESFCLMCVESENQLENTIKTYGKPTEIVLIRYKKDDFKLFNPDFGDMPESIHSATLGRLKTFAEAKCITVKIIYFDPILYREWKGERKDSRELRSSWAALAYDSVDTVKAATESGQKENRQ